MRQLKNYYIYTSRLKSCRNLNKILKLKKNDSLVKILYYIKKIITLRMLDAANHQEKKNTAEVNTVTI